MARPRRIDPELVVKARAVVAQATDAKTLRAAQAVLMPALAHTTLEQTAALLGVGRASVPRLQRRFREGLQLVRSSPSWGGRRRALRTAEGQNGSELRQSHCVAHRPSTLKNPFLSHYLAPPHFRLKPLAVLSLKAEG